MINILKEILFWIALICGSVSLICLILCGTWKCICLLIDHSRDANKLREIIKYYIDNKTSRKVKIEDIRLDRMGIERRKDNE